jgi:HKD family nuclease
MRKEFILQGFTARTHSAAIKELFQVPDIIRVVLSVAFVTESGVQQIESALRQHTSYVTVFAGIRNDITTYQGLVLLSNIVGNLYTVDTGSRAVIFHPKVYLVRGNVSARLVIGSANLTLAGLNNNIEAGMLLDFDLTDSTDQAAVDEIEAQFATLPTDHPSHIEKIGARADLDRMLASGRLVDEMAMPPPRPVTSAKRIDGSDTLGRIKLKVPSLHRPFTRATASAVSAPASVQIPQPVGVEFELVWESKPLTRRDLTIPDARGTHATGSVNLDKGLLPEDVDHRHYFREEIFPHLQWSPRSPTVDEAFTKFQLVLKGISYGEFDLAIHHTNSTTSRAYLQRNAMTRLSWGSMRRTSPDKT